MKESFEHDPNRNFDWKEGVSLTEKDKLIEYFNNEGFYTTKRDESTPDSTKADKALRKARLIIPEQDKEAILSQINIHKKQFKDEYDEFINNDEILIEIENELARMNLKLEDFDRDTEFHDPVARDQFEEMAQTYRNLAERNIQIANKLRTLNNTLN